MAKRKITRLPCPTCNATLGKVLYIPPEGKQRIGFYCEKCRKAISLKMLLPATFPPGELLKEFEIHGYDIGGGYEAGSSRVA